MSDKQENLPASISAECKLWRVSSGEYEPDADPQSKWGVFWEPLDVRLGPDARPHCCYGEHIAFYDHSGNRLLADLVQHYQFRAARPHLIFLAGKWREVVSGRCEHRNGQWCMRWSVATHTRWARRLNDSDEVEALRGINESLVVRVAAQSELLTRRAEKSP